MPASRAADLPPRHARELDPGERGGPARNVVPPDAGRVEPYGEALTHDHDEEPDVDSPVWTCTSCGYQWQRRGEPMQCPNCASMASFVTQD